MPEEDCSGWLKHCRSFAREHEVSARFVRVLFAFGGPSSAALGHSHFSELENHAIGMLARVPAQIVDVLNGEVDRPQAVMFARRFSSVIDLLNQQAAHHPEARLFRVGIILRMTEVLNDPGPRALRVRAVADYFYSHCALLHHRPGPQSLPPTGYDELIHSVAWREVAPGIRHKRVTGLTDHGPIHVNVLALRGARLRALDCRAENHTVSLESVAIRENAPAAVSGGFFLYSEADIELPSRRTDPVSVLIDNGELINPPMLNRASLIQSYSGTNDIIRLGPQHSYVTWNGGASLLITAHNAPPTPEHVTTFNRAWGVTSPAPPTGWNIATVGTSVTAVSQSSLSIPLAGLVIHLPLGEPPQVGDTLLWQLPKKFHGQAIHNAMAGGPLLLQDGELCISREAEDFMHTAPPVTFSRDETFDQNLLPRMACGMDAEGTLFFAAIDGRNFFKAPGMTLEHTARWMQALGCVRAMNLDGGSSKRMVVDRRVVDSPSTEVVGATSNKQHVRPVHSAILIFPGDLA